MKPIDTRKSGVGGVGASITTMVAVVLAAVLFEATGFAHTVPVGEQLNVVEARVAATSDDAEEGSPADSVSLKSSDLELVFDDDEHQTIGMRFNHLGIPPAAEIIDAYIQFQADEKDSETTRLTIAGEDVDNASTFSSNPGDISSRERTTAYVSWFPEPWTVRGAAGHAQRTPNIAPVIQEIVDRPGWASGNSLVAIITGMGKRVAESYDGDEDGAPLLHVEYKLRVAPDGSSTTTTTLPLATTTLEICVAADSDDAEEPCLGDPVLLTSSDLEMVFNGEAQIVGMRFNHVAIPNGATILDAYIQFTANETDSETTLLMIQGEDVDHATTFSSAPGNISSRTRTTASVPWSPPPWTTTGVAGHAQHTSNIAEVIQEIVERDGWSSGNSLVIIVTGAGRRVAESYDGTPEAAPKLHVEYTMVAPTTTSTTTSSTTSTTTSPHTTSTVPPISTSTTTTTGLSTSTTTTLPPQAPTVDVTVDIRVDASSDDAEERSVHDSVRLKSSDLELVFDKKNQTVGMRFNHVGIPRAAEILDAYVQFQVDEKTSVYTQLAVRGEDVDHAPTFTSDRENISSRTTTTAWVPWSPPPWTMRGAAGHDQRTPNIASVIQEIVDRHGWLGGNSLVVIITGTGERVAESYDGDEDGAPLLHVEFRTTCGNGVVEPGETCDGNCPVSCDDTDACTIDVAAGTAATCDVVCTSYPVTHCRNHDGCCPADCNAVNDRDCSAVCGNLIVEPGETCDGNCPVSCDDGDICTTDILTGSPATCDVACDNDPVTFCLDGDGCCPSGCSIANDDDCTSLCGNGILEPPEDCDGSDAVACSGLCRPDCTCPPVQFLDDFNRADADDLGNAWEVQPGSPVDHWTLTNNAALMTFTNGSFESRNARMRPQAEAVENVRGSVDFNTSDPINFPQIWLRFQDITTSSLDGYLFYVSNDPGFETGVIRERNGAFAWQRTATWAPAANRNYRMNATVENGPGNDVICSLQVLDLDAGGTEVFNRTWTDDGSEGCGGPPPCSIRGPGRSGLSGFGGCIGCTLEYDNFTIFDLDSGPPSTTTTVPTTSTTTTLPPGGCGDNVVNQPGEDCDGTDDIACPGLCQPACTCPPSQFFDDFNRANADDLGNNWEAQTGNPVDHWSLNNNVALMTFTNGSFETRNARVRPLTEAVQNVRAVVRFNTSNAVNFPQIWLRVLDASTTSLDGYIFYVSDNSQPGSAGNGVIRLRNLSRAWMRTDTSWVPSANTNYLMIATLLDGAGNNVDATLRVLDLDAGGVEVFNRTWTDDGTEGCGGPPPCSIRDPGRSGLSGYGGCIGCTTAYDNFTIFDLDLVP